MIIKKALSVFLNELTPFETILSASISSPESVSSKIESFGFSIDICKISFFFFSPPEKPTLSCLVKISSSKFGEGCVEGSNKTPLGAHYIKEFIGSDAPAYTIFKNRVPTSQKVEIVLGQENSNEDIISSRILWLDGLDKGKNKGGNVDSYTRYIYIHGTNEEGLIGKKASHGCIRMSNNDIINLCKKDLSNTFVYIYN